MSYVYRIQICRICFVIRNCDIIMYEICINRVEKWEEILFDSSDNDSRNILGVIQCWFGCLVVALDKV